METWMMLAAGGGVLGLIALGGMLWAFKKLESPKKWGAIVAFALLGGVGAYLGANATALDTTEEEAAIEQEAADAFDDEAPLDDDF